MPRTKATPKKYIPKATRTKTYVKAGSTARKQALGVSRASADAFQPVTVPRYFPNKPEIKKASVSLNYTKFNSAISNSTSDQIYLMPQVIQGVQQSQRLGQKIRLVKMVVTGHVALDTDQYTRANAFLSRLFVYQNKSNLTASHANPGGNEKLIDLGGTGTPYNGSVTNQHTPFNLDGFYCYLDKQSIHQKGWGLANTDAQAMTDTTQGGVVPFSVVFEPNTKNGVPMYIQYDEAQSATYPMNFNPQISLGYCYAQNNPPDTAWTELGMSWVSTLYYTDA